MKRINLLIPLAATISSAAIPAMTLTSCNQNKDVTVDQKEISSGDSYTTYKCKLPSVPTDKKVTVNIINKSTEQEQVYFDPDLTNANSYLDTTVLTTDDEGNVEVPVCYYVAPTNSSSSNFGLTFTYNNESETKTVDDLTFNYNVDYDVDLKDGAWESKITPATAEHWTDGVAAGKTISQIYMEDIVSNPTIFQSDARYSTSKNIKAAIDVGEISGLNSFRAYFNNVYADQYGLNVQMNYEVKSGSEGKFEFIQPQQDGNNRKYTFTNFDLSCNFMTENGYKFSWDATDPKHFNLTDEHGNYDLIGRMKGRFTSKVQRYNGSTWEVVSEEQTIDYDGLITLDEESNEETYSKQFISFMFAFGLIHLTYDFDWATEAPSLKILSSYAQNA